MKALSAAYAKVVARYGTTTVDFDVEGKAVTDRAANARRAQAVAALQKTIRAAGGRLAVWLTLPADTGGLSADAVGVVDGMLAAGVDLGGVNAMTMDFGGSRSKATG